MVSGAGAVADEIRNSPFYQKVLITNIIIAAHSLACGDPKVAVSIQNGQLVTEGVIGIMDTSFSSLTDKILNSLFG